MVFKTCFDSHNGGLSRKDGTMGVENNEKYFWYVFFFLMIRKISNSCNNPEEEATKDSRFNFWRMNYEFGNGMKKNNVNI